MRKTALLAWLVSLCGFALVAAETVDLNGVWEFRLEQDRSIEELNPPEFTANDRMTVPGCWDAMSRYWNKRGTGCYRRKFETLTDSANAFLVVDGMGLRLRAWLDGRDLGLSVLPWMRLELPAGPLKAGSHEIVVCVDSMVDGEKTRLFSDSYDFYPHGGIYHGMSLVLTDAKEDSRKLIVRTRDFHKGIVEIELCYDDKVPETVAADVSFDGRESRPVRFENGRALLIVPEFRLWSPESPNLHKVLVTSGRVALSARFGIRQIATAKGRITLNGKPIYLKGVNRHEEHWEFGTATPQALLYEDLANIKDLGANFVRGCHYPQCEAFLDLCDELGVMVWEESLGWGNQTNHFEDAKFCRLQEEQTRLMVRNSINHPSVVISGFLNEPASESESCCSLVGRLVDVVRAEDSGHLVAFACHRNESDICNDKTDLIAYNAYPYWYSYPPKTGTHEEMVRNIKACHTNIIAYFRGKYHDKRPIVVSETGVKADYGARDKIGRAQYTEDFQDEYTRATLETLASLPDIAGVILWHYADAKTYTRKPGLVNRSYGLNTGGLFDRFRRPKLAVDTVREFYSGRLLNGDPPSDY